MVFQIYATESPTLTLRRLTPLRPAPLVVIGMIPRPWALIHGSPSRSMARYTWEVECRSRKLILWKREVEGFVEGREARLNFKKNSMFNWAYNTVLWCFMAFLPFELMGNFDFNWTVGENWVPKKPGESCRNDETTKRPGRFNGFFRQRTARLKRSHWRRCFGVFCWNELVHVGWKVLILGDVRIHHCNQNVPDFSMKTTCFFKPSKLELCFMRERKEHWEWK